MRWFGLLVCFLLTACGGPTVTIGSKPTVQDQILGEIMAAMVEEAGIPVTTRHGLGEAPVMLEALRVGAVDVYPEYSGTALGLLGLPGGGDAETALDRARAAFEARGYRLLAPFGFESRFVAVTRRDFTVQTGAADLRELAAAPPPDLRIGVTQSFAERPRDGLRPALDRVGLTSVNVTVVDGAARDALYRGLLERKFDLIVGYSTDPEILDFGLEIFPTGPGTFPSYAAAPLVASRALEAHPELEAALSALEGAFDERAIRRLVREVNIAGRTPAAVARAALRSRGLIEGEVRSPDLPLAVAVEPGEIGGQVANTALRAVRTALPGRAVSLATEQDPGAAIAARTARLAVLPAAAQFDLDEAAAVVANPHVEAIAVVGTADLYALAMPDGPAALGDAARIATGPEGSASHRLGQMVARVLEHRPTLVAAPRATAAALAAQVISGAADAALVVASRGRRDIDAVLRAGAVRLVDGASWWQGAARLDTPFLREAVIPDTAHTALDRPVQTVAMQFTLAAPAAPRDRGLGASGPVSFSDQARPLSAGTVRALNAAVGPGQPAIGPHLQRAAALTPVIAPPPSALNPAPEQAILSLGIFGFLALVVWLFINARPRGQ